MIRFLFVTNILPEKRPFLIFGNFALLLFNDDFAICKNQTFHGFFSAKFCSSLYFNGTGLRPILHSPSLDSLSLNFSYNTSKVLRAFFHSICSDNFFFVFCRIFSLSKQYISYIIFLSMMYHKSLKPFLSIMDRILFHNSREKVIEQRG